jgi:hypothetical protein
MGRPKGSKNGAITTHAKLCEYCSAPFVIVGREGGVRTRRRFCSVACRGVAMRVPGAKQRYADSDRGRQVKRDWIDRNHDRLLADRRAVYQERRRHIIARYGGRCVCCGETEIGFLTIDHVANDGAAHRKLNMRAMRLAYFITRNGYPPDFQVLCYNCNCAKGALGECPHLKKVPMGM